MVMSDTCAVSTLFVGKFYYVAEIVCVCVCVCVLVGLRGGC